jgi:hypothetical protein
MIKLTFPGFLLLLSFSASAQIQGDILDPNDKGVLKALIIATPTTIGSRPDTVKSGQLGFYEFRNLKPGIYRIEIKATGFQTVVIEKVEVKEEDTGFEEGEDDIYHGQRLDFILVPAKTIK